VDALKRDHRGRPILIELPQRALLMEGATNALWASLKRLTNRQLQSVQPTGEFVPLFEALVYIRVLMGEDTATALTIEDLERTRRTRGLSPA
jgi:hypothetical protein